MRVSRWYFGLKDVYTVILGATCGVVVFSLMSQDRAVVDRPVVARPVVVTPTVTPTATPVILRRSRSNRGTASFYSREGCAGCSASLTMANGQSLDDGRLTVAYNRVRLGSFVRITNVKNGLQVTAEVTDTGGFEKLDRIIDLTVATRDAIGCSHLCEVIVDHL